MGADEYVPRGIDPTVPSVARIYDYFLGGKDNFAADREAAEKLMELARLAGADSRETSRANRGFLVRAVRHIAQSGVRQFLDIGTGLPTQDNVHQVAQRTAPDSKIVYVDNDPIVLVHARALLADNEGTSIVEGDMHDPRDILKSASAYLDFSKPVAIIAAAVLHFVGDDDEALAITAALREALVPGGYLVISHAYVEPAAVHEQRTKEVLEVYERSSSRAFAMRTADEIARYFDGLELLSPGVVPAHRWRNDDPFVPPGLQTGGCLAAVGLKH
ncbi:SAM-dependent methyltransferase [Streptosporangiaceae bacterium NEAU-GS5]|nr:SAM-dependent methyltransferase [Streptosporangiaceae bacterium NEAU-GS5]